MPKLVKMGQINLISKSLDMDGTCSTYGENRTGYRIMAAKAEGKRHLGKT
jgi:hypothetical protein